jgi:hypothetical protein
MTAPDHSFLPLRRLELLSDRMEMLYTALHIALLVSFVAVLYALYTVREDILQAIERI